MVRTWRSLPGQATLRWAQETLEPVLARQVLSGEELQKVAPLRFLEATEVAIEQIAIWDRSAAAWHQDNREVLRQAFSNSRVLDRYDPPADRFQVEMSDTSVAHSARLERLKRIGDLIHLFEVAPDASTEPMQAPQGSPPVPLPPQATQIFLVHGRDDPTKNWVARTMQQLAGAEPVILQEQPDGGDTVIEKFERHAGAAAAAVVILSPDDVGSLAGDVLQPRARQNVVYELGWFHGRLGRDRVIALLVDDVEQPSDISGVLYLRVDPAGAWRYRLGHELAHIGLDVDLNRLR